MLANVGGKKRSPANSVVPSRAIAVLSWPLSIVVVLGALLIVSGGAIALIRPAMLVSPHEMNAAAHVYAGYLVSRNLVLGLMLLAALGLRAKTMLANLMLLTGFVQLFDACLDCVEGRWAIVPGVLVFGFIFLVGSARLSGYPFWRMGAWRQDP